MNNTTHTTTCSALVNIQYANLFRNKSKGRGAKTLIDVLKRYNPMDEDEMMRDLEISKSVIKKNAHYRYTLNVQNNDILELNKLVAAFKELGHSFLIKKSDIVVLGIALYLDELSSIDKDIPSECNINISYRHHLGLDNDDDIKLSPPEEEVDDKDNNEYESPIIESDDKVDDEDNNEYENYDFATIFDLFEHMSNIFYSDSIEFINGSASYNSLAFRLIRERYVGNYIRDEYDKSVLKKANKLLLDLFNNISGTYLISSINITMGMNNTAYTRQIFMTLIKINARTKREFIHNILILIPIIQVFYNIITKYTAIRGGLIKQPLQGIMVDKLVSIINQRAVTNKKLAKLMPNVFLSQYNPSGYWI